MKRDSLVECFLSVTFKLSITMSTTTLNQTLPPPNYCVLPTQHSHSFPTILLQDLALDEEEEELIFNSKTNSFTNKQHDHQITTNNQTLSNVGDANSKFGRSLENLQALTSTAITTSVSSSKQNFLIDHHYLTALGSGLDEEIYANQQQQQHFDPYIDAVQVKSRINNKRGARVKALESPRDHEPKPSYYSRTVHVETSTKKEDHHNHDADWETDDDDNDDDDDDHDHDDHHHHHYSADKKHGRKKVYKVKAYPVKGYKKKNKKKKGKKNNHYYYLHGGGGGKHGGGGASGYGYDKGGYNKYNKGKGKGKKGYKRKKKLYGPKKKKVTYAYIYTKPKTKHYHSHDDHYDDGKYKYHQKHHHGKDKYKMVHMDHHQLMDHHHKGGKMSIAGLLGYTLLCVNYLLVLKQPTYDKYNSHEYTKYSPHDKHGKGELVHVKGSGPVILAHCAELEAEKLYRHQFSASNNIRSIRSTNPKLVDHFMKKLSNASLESAESYDYHHSNDHHSHDDDHSSSGLYYLRRNNARSPPAYYYTLSPSYGSNQHSVGSYSGNSNGYGYSHYETSSNGGGLLSPIQNYLNRLLLPAGDDQYHGHDEHQHDDNYSYAPIRVVGSPRARFGNNNRAAGGRVIVGGQANGRSLIGGVNNARLIIVDGQPQVVKQRDNLVDLRSRQVDIQMHVIRRNFVGAQQMVDIPEDPDFMLARRGNLGVQVPIAVRPPNNNQILLSQNENTGSEQMQADQPIDSANNSSPNNGANNQILDLPEFALSGDSIELTCNHRIPISRMYSVKWFKDSLEFYRFIPANGARSKSSLYLPDVRLDLARSNSQMLYLRNVTHRTSGLYRCEVVSGK